MHLVTISRVAALLCGADHTTSHWANARYAIIGFVHEHGPIAIPIAKQVSELTSQISDLKAKLCSQEDSAEKHAATAKKLEEVRIIASWSVAPSTLEIVLLRSPHQVSPPCFEPPKAVDQFLRWLASSGALGVLHGLHLHNWVCMESLAIP